MSFKAASKHVIVWTEPLLQITYKYKNTGFNNSMVLLEDFKTLNSTFNHSRHKMLIVWKKKFTHNATVLTKLTLVPFFLSTKYCVSAFAPASTYENIYTTIALTVGKRTFFDTCTFWFFSKNSTIYEGR